MTKNTSLGLYIHWPFCQSKCPYCDFNSHVREAIEPHIWQHALLTELEWVASRYRDLGRAGEGIYQKGRIHNKPVLGSIFFGGGTPSLMPPDMVTAILSKAAELFLFTEDIEITLEANPMSVEMMNFAALKAAGINRLSIGVQSLRDDNLHMLGRRHDSKQAVAAVELAAKIFTRYSFDLIYALPGQDIAAWEQELKEALRYAGGHISLYQLTVEPGTKFFHLQQAGRLQLPNEELAADLYMLTQEITEAVGVPAYEISNHASLGQYSRHNMNYWCGGEYIAIGAGAHGRWLLPIDENFKGGYIMTDIALNAITAKLDDCARDIRQKVATTNWRSPEKWLQQVQKYGHGLQDVAVLSRRQQIEEVILMGLRLRSGIYIDYMPEIVSNFAELWPEALLAGLQQEELIEISTNNLRVTEKGRLLLNSIIHTLCTNLLLAEK